MYDFVWEVRERLSKLFLIAANKLNPDYVVDIRRGAECQEICLDVWNGKSKGQELRDRIYAALY